MSEVILWVEDGVFEVKAYIAVFERRGWKVLTKSVKDAVEYLRGANDLHNFKLVLIDLMMDTIDLDFAKLDFSKADTMNGLATGVMILKKIRELDRKLPCVYFTNVDKETAMGKKIFEYAMKGEDKKTTLWLHKSDVLPRELVGIVKGFMRSRKS